MAKKKATITITSKKKKKDSAPAKKAEKSFSLGDLPDELVDRGRDVWLAGVGAWAAVGEEGAKVFDELVAKGKKWEEKGRKQLGKTIETLSAKQDEVSEKVGAATTQLDARLSDTLEESLEAVVKRLGVPTRAEVKSLTDQVQALSAKVETLAGTLEASKPRTTKRSTAKTSSAKGTGTTARSSSSKSASAKSSTTKAPSKSASARSTAAKSSKSASSKSSPAKSASAKGTAAKSSASKATKTTTKKST